MLVVQPLAAVRSSPSLRVPLEVCSNLVLDAECAERIVKSYVGRYALFHWLMPNTKTSHI